MCNIILLEAEQFNSNSRTMQQHRGLLHLSPLNHNQLQQQQPFFLPFAGSSLHFWRSKNCPLMPSIRHSSGMFSTILNLKLLPIKTIQFSLSGNKKQYQIY